MYCENIPLHTLAQRHDTPLYVYSEAAVTQAFQAYQQAFAGALIAYSVKANGNIHLLRHLAQLGSGFDIVSGGELARVLAAGAAPQKIIFSGVGKTRQEIRAALTAGIKCFNVESMSELERLHAIASDMGVRAPVSLRINPDVDPKTHAYISTGLKENKFGIAHADALGAYRQAAKLSGVQVLGIDCHIGSQLLDVTPLLEALQKLLELVDALQEEGIALSHLDMGGGLGIAYEQEIEPDIQAFAQKVRAQLGHRKLDLMLEPGRSIVGNSGALLTRVEYHKAGLDKDFIVVDAAMNDLIRPALYDAHHEIVNIADPIQSGRPADIVGPVCESGDFLGKNRYVAAQQDDVLAVLSAGAYAASMASNYNTRARAAEVWVSGSEATLIRPRETIEAMLAAELALKAP